MKFSEKDLEWAVTNFGMCQYFPQSDPVFRAALQLLLAKMVPDKQALDWLVGEFVNRIGTWYGSAALRGVLCWKYKPADGIECTSSIPGYRPEDGEARIYEEHQQLKSGGWTAETEGLQIAESSRKLIDGIRKDWPQ